MRTERDEPPPGGLRARARAAQARARTVRHVIVFVLALVAAATGILLYFDERDTRQRVHYAGAASPDDGVLIKAELQKVDPVAQNLTLRVDAYPQGRLQDAADAFTPSQDFTVYTSSLLRGKMHFKAGERVTTQEVAVALDDGTVTNYPFDRYAADVGFSAVSEDKQLAVRLEFQDTDPFFSPRVGDPSTDSQVAALDLDVRRSRSTFILAWLMMFIMWGLALAVLAATWFVIDHRKGLVWAAMSWMAATLFALAGFRNAAPGTPPFGSLIDYAAFLWAEGVIALCLVAVTAYGIRVEKAQIAEAEGPPPT
ncbi:DUF4436 family protein [Streptomyces sp. NPDC050418]|uniref:DUF4436 family protein n=1 Tax=Streptomyces sp. NPDC050418 TaxID=3365612 RepID=UPI0037B6864B